jgi:O-antigen/teichoic acid export membrane protein
VSDVVPEGLYDSRRLARNVLASVAGEGISKGAAFLAAVVVARTVTAADFGRFTFVLALVGFALLLSDVGLQVAGTRLVAADRERTRAFLGAALVLGVAVAALSYAALGAAALLGLLPAGTARPVAIFATVLILSAATNAYWSVLRGHERQDLVYLSYSISSLALLGGVLVASVLGASLETILAVYVAAYCLRLVLAFALARLDRQRVRPRLEPDTMRLLVRAAPAIAVAYVLLGVYSHVDVVLLGFFVSPEDVGDYGAAYRLVDAATFLTAGAAATAAFPVFARLAREASAAAYDLFARLGRLLAALLTPATLVTIALAEPLTRFVYGTGLENADRLLALLAPSILLIALNYLTAMFALAIELTRLAVACTAIAATVNVVANLVAVPLVGVEGAALATFLGEVVLVACFAVGLRRAGRGYGLAVPAATGLLLVALPVGLAELVGAGRVPILLGGALVALAAARPLGLVHARDATLVRALLLRRPA